MRKSNRLLQARIAVMQHKLDVHGVAVAQRDRRLQPLELHPPRAPERIGSGFELAKILHRIHRNSCEAGVERSLCWPLLNGNWMCAGRPRYAPVKSPCATANTALDTIPNPTNRPSRRPTANASRSSPSPSKKLSRTTGCSARKAP